MAGNPGPVTAMVSRVEAALRRIASDLDSRQTEWALTADGHLRALASVLGPDSGLSITAGQD